MTNSYAQIAKISIRTGRVGRLVMSDVLSKTVAWHGVQPGIVVGAKIFPVSVGEAQKYFECSGSSAQRPGSERS
jgi:hypothetical protein